MFAVCKPADRLLHRHPPVNARPVNLAGIDHTAVRRGMTLAKPGNFRATRRIDAQFTLLPGTHKLKHRERVHLHAATAETIAEISFYGAGELAPGKIALAHLRLQDEMVLTAGERFIVRQFSPVTTIGGGVVLILRGALFRAIPGGSNFSKLFATAYGTTCLRPSWRERPWDYFMMK